MWSTSAGGHLMKVVNLTGFTVPFDGDGDRKQSDKPMHRLCIVWSRVKRYVENVV